MFVMALSVPVNNEHRNATASSLSVIKYCTIKWCERMGTMGAVSGVSTGVQWERCERRGTMGAA